MNDILAHYSPIIQELIDSSELFNAFFNHLHEVDEEDYADEMEYFFPFVSFHCGAFRGCFVDHQYPYIIKFDLQPYKWEHCKKEIQIYEKAQRLGFSQYFAAPLYIGDCLGLRLYAYPRAHLGPKCDYPDLPKKIYNFLDKSHSPLRGRNLAVAIDFFYCYGKHEFKTFSKFCTQNKICDLHRNNVGRIDNKLILIDYAGDC